MGKVFSWDEIENRRIPQSSDFPVVINGIRRDLENTDGVIGGIFCGSVMWNNYNQRSDIDCVLVYDPAKRLEVVSVLRAINRAAADFYIPAEMIPVDLEMAQTTLHDIAPTFVMHLERAIENGGLVKENPLPFFSFDFSDASVSESVRSYLRGKLRKLENGISTLPVMEVAEVHRFLHKILEAPVHIARKILLWQRVEMPDDSKRTVMRCYPDVATRQEYELFAKITSADARYTAELLAQLQSPDKTRYSRVIEEIKGLALDTLEFVRFNAFRFV